eukprot:653129-Pyramimonas_sp.AAC.1
MRRSEVERGAGGGRGRGATANQGPGCSLPEFRSEASHGNEEPSAHVKKNNATTTRNEEQEDT